MNKLLSGPLSTTWTWSRSNMLRSLTQGVGKGQPSGQKVVGTDTIHIIPRYKVPVGTSVTYTNFICDIRPLKEEEHRTRLTVGGNKSNYCGNPSSPVISLLDMNIFLNSFIYDAHTGARYSTVDINNYYLNNPMDIFQYMKIPTRFFTPKIQS